VAVLILTRFNGEIVTGRGVLTIPQWFNNMKACITSSQGYSAMVDAGLHNTLSGIRNNAKGHNMAWMFHAVELYSLSVHSAAESGGNMAQQKRKVCRLCGGA
jgi:hypothetical protein